jgi:hypothetical protein
MATPLRVEFVRDIPMDLDGDHYFYPEYET